MLAVIAVIWTVWMKKDEDGDEKRIQCVVCAVGAGQCSGRLRRNNNLTNKGCDLIKPSDRDFCRQVRIEDDRLIAGKEKD